MNLRFLFFASLFVANTTIVPASNCYSPTPADKATVAATLKALACSSSNNSATATSFVDSITPKEWAFAKNLLSPHIIARCRSLSLPHKASPSSTPPTSAPQSPSISPLGSPSAFKSHKLSNPHKSSNPLAPYPPDFSL
jgi:hypothetical protein